MNLVLLLAAAGWVVAQILKVIIVLVLEKKLDIRYILSSGGMPSSHSATVCACAVSTGMIEGFTSPVFALAAILAFVVMYDAFNVRKETGEQAKILNYMMEHWSQLKPELFANELKELIGHTFLQVLVGGLLGLAIGFFGCQLLL